MTSLFRYALVTAVAAGICSMPAAAQDDSAEAQPRDLRAYYIKDGLKLSAYDSVLLDSLGLEDARVLPPPWVQGDARSPTKWRLTEKDKNWLRNSYRTIVGEAIAADGGPAIVSQPGPGVLIVDIEIVGIMPYARRGEKVTTKGFGEALVQAQFRDGATKELLAVFEGWQDVGTEYRENSRLNNENNIRALFRMWGSRLRGLLDE
ncbi:MAG: DUF3313 family protein [Gammaproteobacteria bacterium]|nr:DUF3313 family protein [Gammaproteobacteria bacterium]